MAATTPTSGYTAPTLWYVRSDTDATHFYAVSTDARGLLRCECKASQYRRTPCKHVRAVVAGSVRPATVKATAAAATPRRLPIDDMDGAAPFSVDDFYSDAGAAIERSVAQLRRTRDGSQLADSWGHEVPA